jgi:hypothetical protein
MKYIATCFLILSVPLLVRGETQRAERTPTADALSAVAMSGMRLATIDYGAKLSTEERTCLSNIDNSALRPVFVSLLRNSFSAPELASLDVFYSSALGEKYGLYLVEQARSDLGHAPSIHTHFQAFEINRINTFVLSPAGLKLSALASKSNAVTGAALRPAMQGLIRGCTGDS